MRAASAALFFLGADMANFPYYPSAGALGITGNAPTIYAGGVTTFEASNSMKRTTFSADGTGCLR